MRLYLIHQCKFIIHFQCNITVIIFISIWLFLLHTKLKKCKKYINYSIHLISNKMLLPSFIFIARGASVSFQILSGIIFSCFQVECMVLLLLSYLRGGDPKVTRNFLKKIIYFSEHFHNLITSKYSPREAIHLSRSFFHCSKQFWNSCKVIAFIASVVFSLTSSTF
jgi:hypothetical protein